MMCKQEGTVGLGLLFWLNPSYLKTLNENALTAVVPLVVQQLLLRFDSRRDSVQRCICLPRVLYSCRCAPVAEIKMILVPTKTY